MRCDDDSMTRELWEYTSPLEFARKRLGFEPDATQARVLGANAHRGILCCSRQWGKSTVTAVLAVHRGLTHPKSLTLVSTPGLRQSGEFVAKGRSSCGRWR